MKILVTGATGFIGRRLVPRLRRDGHSVVAWVRDASRARNLLGVEAEILDARGGRTALVSALDECDGIVNLAGEPIMGGRWTSARRRLLRESRVDLTAALTSALAAAQPRPRVLISQSAVGFYGDRGNERLDEGSKPGTDFLAGLCQDWEAVAQAADGPRLRVVRLRTGVVLGRDGGALAPMLPPFRLCLGGPVGSGRQYFPSIHLNDLVDLITTTLADGRYQGPVNAVAPEEVTSRDLARALGRVLHRPAVLPVPALALRAIFGEAATVLLASQRVNPGAAHAHGFTFAFPRLETALADVLDNGTDVAVGPIGEGPPPDSTQAGRQYLEQRPPVYELRTTTTVHAPLEQTFAFFASAANLGMLTPAAMGFTIVGAPPTIAEGAVLDYRFRVAHVPFHWRSRIVNWRPGQGFVDLQDQGPYGSWWHEHSFRAAGQATVMEDRVRYAPPFGVLGRLANRRVIVPALRRIFRHRADMIRLRFGTA